MPEINSIKEASYPFLPEVIPVTQQQWPDEVPPLLSISCITYMHENFIRDAIEGFLMQQTNFKIEILIHDDASTDKTADIVREYEKKYPQLIIATYQIENQFKKSPKTLKYIQPPEKQGFYIAYCEGDDYWTDPMKLQKQVDFLEANLEYSFSYCRFKTLNEETGEFRKDNNEELFENEVNTVKIDFERLYKGWHMGTQTLVYRKNSFDPSIRNKYEYFKDIHLITHLLLKGKGSCLGFFGAVYRIHKGGIFSGATEYQNAKLHYLCFKEIYKNNKLIFFLKLKYIRYTQFYIDHLLKNREYNLALAKSIEVFFLNKDIHYLMKIIQIFLKRNIKKV